MPHKNGPIPDPQREIDRAVQAEQDRCMQILVHHHLSVERIDGFDRIASLIRNPSADLRRQMDQEAA